MTTELPRLHIKNASLLGQHQSDLWVENGLFVNENIIKKKNAQIIDLEGKLIIPGLVESHLHLDKACILHRCEPKLGTLTEAIETTAREKLKFNEEDIFKRGAKVLEKAISQGTSYVRTHIEIDPDIGLKGFDAVKELKKQYAWGIDLQLCVFPQEGLINNPGTESLLCQALENGADLLGGCPYTDSKPKDQIKRLFELAKHYDCDLDFHLDFDLDTNNMSLIDVIELTEKFNWQNRVAVGHVTKLSALHPDELEKISKKLAEYGIAVTSLPSTDLFLTGREYSHNIPRGVVPLIKLDQYGVACSVSSNNISNPFTPYGDASLVRQANLMANVTQLATQEDLLRCLSWISESAAKILRLENYGMEEGDQADFIVFNTDNAHSIIEEILSPCMAFKNGIKTFERPDVILFKPNL